MEDGIVYITVVRDFSMYSRCLQENANMYGARRVVFDNREKNEPITVLYNRFLDSYDYTMPAWFVFCHEDFSPDERIEDVMSGLPKDSLWGPIGAVTEIRWGVFCRWRGVGGVTILGKDGMAPASVGECVPNGFIAETLDYCCLVVHSSLIKENRMRFDENLSFDLYVEDFCISANEKHSIPTRIVNFCCRHFSKASPGPRYRKQHKYLNRKWRGVSYSSPCSWNIGCRFGVRLATAKIKESMRLIQDVFKTRKER